MSRITTHVLDTSRGTPAAGMGVRLQRQDAGAWRDIASGVTNADGRIQELVPAGVPIPAGTYRLRFETGPYLTQHTGSAFYPMVDVVCVLSGDGHHHVPLLLSPFGYSTYRGS